MNPTDIRKINKALEGCHPDARLNAWDHLHRALLALETRVAYEVLANPYKDAIEAACRAMGLQTSRIERTLGETPWLRIEL
jgi:hypothetical protein